MSVEDDFKPISYNTLKLKIHFEIQEFNPKFISDEIMNLKNIRFVLSIVFAGLVANHFVLCIINFCAFNALFLIFFKSIKKADYERIMFSKHKNKLMYNSQKHRDLTKPNLFGNYCTPGSFLLIKDLIFTCVHLVRCV